MKSHKAYYLIVLQMLLLYPASIHGYRRTRPEITKFPRQAPFCVMDEDEPDLKNFKEIFKYHNSNPEKFIPVSPNKWQSPTGFIKNISLSGIYISSTKYPDMKANHPYREFHNFFHITITADPKSDGMEGLYVQANSAPLGIPIGEFVADFDCGDCFQSTSDLHRENGIAIVPCEIKPAASFLQPQVFTVGGNAAKPKKFWEAHFHFRYIDYPCFDVTFAQFLIIAVRRFDSPLQYEIFNSPVYKVGIEGVGAPYPMYYGWTPSEIDCHNPNTTVMQNWFPQKNQKAKIRYSAEYDECIYTTNEDKKLGNNVCPPGPITCTTNTTKAPESGGEWAKFREDYSSEKNPKRGSSPICLDCGEWEDKIGGGLWPRPPIITDSEDVSINEIIITRKPIFLYDLDCDESTEANRSAYAKRPDGGRDNGKTSCPNTIDQQIATKGFHWGRDLILTAHNALLLFTWTVGSNCIIYCSRFLKEASFAEKGSNCFGIGKWMWEKIFWTYICFTAIFAGVSMMAFQDPEDICNIYDTSEDTRNCMESSTGHKLFGSVACLLFLMGFLSGWIRPQTRLLRNTVIWYHILTGYLSKYLGLSCLFFSRQLFGKTGVAFIITLEVSFIIFYIAATVVQKMMDNRMKFRVRERLALPVPEGIDTFSDPPLKNTRALLFPLMIFVQLTLFSFAAFSIWDEKVATRF